MSGGAPLVLGWRPAAIQAAADGDAAAVARLVEGESWTRFCEVLRRNGEKIADPALPASDLDRATAYRHLLAMLRLGINEALTAPAPSRLSLQPWRTDVYKFGHDCPDALYHSAPIRGDVVYRIHGHVGSARYLSFQVEGPAGTIANLRRDQMAVGPDGSFEIWVGPQRREGDWLRSGPQTDQLFVRQFFSDWDTEAPASIAIEALAEDVAPMTLEAHPGRPERVAAQIGAVADWFDAIVDYYLDRERTDRLRWPNAFMPPRTTTNAGGAQDILMSHGHFDLAPGTAMIIEVRPPKALYWSLALANPWRESLDYAIRQTSLNDSQARLDEDGVFRAVVAHTDPGVRNWLDTMGHSSGAMILRWVVADSAPEPRVSVVPVERVREHLPMNTPTISPEARLSVIRRRINHVRRRFIM